jgi:hypothetical protein
LRAASNVLEPTRPETMLVAAREPRTAPTREIGMPTTLWKCMVVKG